MATLHECDQCGATIRERELFRVSVQVETAGARTAYAQLGGGRVRVPDLELHRRLDLCESCTRELLPGVFAGEDEEELREARIRALERRVGISETPRVDAAAVEAELAQLRAEVSPAAADDAA